MRVSLRQSAAVFLVLSLVCAGALARPGRWEYLGARTVTDRLDHDVITVTAARGDFRAIKLAVQWRSVDFHRVVVHYANDDVREVELRQIIPAGGETRVIDLPGDERVIRKVSFWYDARSLGGKAKVTLYARN
jgi:hypothetical protein